MELSNENLFIKIYNEIYKLYLDKVESKIFMNKFLNEIINITESNCGCIVSIENDQLVMEACLNIFNNSKEIYENIKDTIKIFENENKNILLISLKSDIYRMIIPLKFNNNIIGILFLERNDIDYADLITKIQELSYMMGVLINNYKNFVYISPKVHLNKKINYFGEILNNINENIILSNDNFDIIFINNNSTKLLNRIINNKNNSKLNFLEIFPKFKYNCFKDGNFNKLFKNYKIKLTHNINNQITELIKINFIINSVIMNNTIYHVIIISDIIENEANKYTTKDQNNFVAFLSHELRNPLQSIILSGYLIKKKLDMIDLDNNTKTQINIINKSSNDMKKIIDDIMDLSKIELDELKIDLNICCTKTILQSLYDEYINLVDYKNLSLNIEIDTICDKIFTDEVRLYQILSNLISNAIKYTDTGCINIKVKHHENYILFEIVDSGIGIKNDDICLLFDKFGQTCNNYNCKKISNGLGLYISQKMANLLGGYIKYQANNGKGCIFTFYHPMNLLNNQNIDIYKNTNLKYNLNGNILLVDDNKNNLRLLKMLLEDFILEFNYKLQIDCTKKGLDAIELTKHINYDIIFMDINMDDIDGSNAAKIIRTNGYKKIIIAMTGNILAINDNFDKKYDVFNHILIKPFNNLKILEILNNYLV